eukprot:Pgem_evm2s20220
MNYIKQNYVTKCEELDLSSQSISSIAENCFSGMASLVFLDLRDNNITSVAPDTFDDSPLLDFGAGNLLLDSETKCTGFAFDIKNNILYRKNDTEFDFVTTDCPTINLTSLNLDGFSFDIFEEINPEILDLSFNHINSLKPWRGTDGWGGIRKRRRSSQSLKLKKLYMNNNSVSDINSIDIFYVLGNHSLEKLEMLHNTINCCNQSQQETITQLFFKQKSFSLTCYDTSIVQSAANTDINFQYEFENYQNNCFDSNKSKLNQNVAGSNQIAIICGVKDMLGGKSAIDFVLDKNDEEGYTEYNSETAPDYSIVKSSNKVYNASNASNASTYNNVYNASNASYYLNIYNSTEADEIDCVDQHGTDPHDTYQGSSPHFSLNNQLDYHDNYEQNYGYVSCDAEDVTGYNYHDNYEQNYGYVSCDAEDVTGYNIKRSVFNSKLYNGVHFSAKQLDFDAVATKSVNHLHYDSVRSSCSGVSGVEYEHITENATGRMVVAKNNVNSPYTGLDPDKNYA